MKKLEFMTILLALLGIARAQGLTIDNQLVIIANDCYTRVAIGSRFSPRDTSVKTGAATVTECEDECSRLRSSCNVFSFGISSKGNGTCLIGTSVPDPEDLQADPDYDIYVRRQDSPDCEPDRLYQIGSGGKKHDDRRRPSDGDRRPVGFGKGVDPPRPGVFQSSKPSGGDRVPNGDHTRPPHGDKQSYGDDRYSHNNRKPGSDWILSNDDRIHDDKGLYGDRTSPYEGNKQFHDDRRPPDDDRRPPYKDGRPSTDGDIPQPGGFGTFSIGRPSGDDRPVTPRPINPYGIDERPDDNDRRPFDDLQRPIGIGQRPPTDDTPRPEMPNTGKIPDRYGDMRPSNRPSDRNDMKYSTHHEGAHGGNYYSGSGQNDGYNYHKPIRDEVIVFDENNPNRPFPPDNSYGFHGYSPNSHKGPEDERFEGTYAGNVPDLEPMDKYEFGNQLDDKYHYTIDWSNGYGISVYERLKCK